MTGDDIVTHTLVVAGAVAGAVAYLHGQIRSVADALTVRMDTGFREVREDLAKERVALATHVAGSDAAHLQHERRLDAVESIQGNHAKTLNRHAAQLAALGERHTTAILRPRTDDRIHDAEKSDSWGP